MNHMHHAFPEHSLIGTCIKLAQSTFYEALPSNIEHLSPTAPAVLPGAKRLPREGALQRWSQAIANWMHRQQVKEREAYLAQAQDIFELERRIRELERRPYY